MTEETVLPLLATVNNIVYGRCRTGNSQQHRVRSLPYWQQSTTSCTVVTEMETQDIIMGVRMSKRLRTRIVAEQQRIARLTGIQPSLNDVARLLLERGLQANGKRR